MILSNILSLVCYLNYKTCNILNVFCKMLYAWLLLPKAASYSWRCVIAHLNFPPTVLYTEAYLDFVSAVVTSYYDVAVRNLHWSIIIPQEFTIANRYCRILCLATANDVPSMAFKNISISKLCSHFNTRPGAKQRHTLYKYWPYIQVLWEREIV
jgi:hypothetical protein